MTKPRSSSPGGCRRPTTSRGTGLFSACGGPTALAIRESLAAGWGDTYSQFRPGQSFDVDALPNGTYYVEVVANPDRRLQETSTTDNRSLRQVILGGTPQNRTITVPPYVRSGS